MDGRYVTFGVVGSTFETRDYALTGANSSMPDRDLPLDAPSVVFTSKAPQHGDVLSGPLDLGRPQKTLCWSGPARSRT